MSFFGKFYFASAKHIGGEEGDAVQELLHMKGATCLRGKDAWQPPADVFETEDGFVILMEMAGVKAQDLTIKISDRAVRVKGVRRELCPRCKLSYLQMEIHHGQFERQVIFNDDINSEKCCARLEDGMLEIFLPKGSSSQTVILQISEE
ncbi:MAG: Hsp20/alpha crystallin family protein [Planctomycetes bacterium]|nr:Hsp20/alpha crystallin family protein [Planctomycetota bacterium]